MNYDQLNLGNTAEQLFNSSDMPILSDKDNITCDSLLTNQILYYHHAVLVHRLHPNEMKLPNLEEQTPNLPKMVKSDNSVFLQKKKTIYSQT